MTCITKTAKLFDLTGKTALVTGGDTGIGYSMASGLAEAGADIIVASTSVELSGSKIEKTVLALGRKFTAFRVDLNDREILYHFMVDLTIRNKHKIDILVNNSEKLNRKSLTRNTDEHWDRVLTFNLDTPFILARELGKQMAERGSGKIIFTSPILGIKKSLSDPGHAASKGALISLVSDLASEWSGKGVNVNGIVPGYILTDQVQSSRKNDNGNHILELIPSARWGNPDDFKGPIVFLSSAAGDYVNGTMLSVDGGWIRR